MSHYPSLRALHAFCRVVELQSFSEAARDLDMTGGAVSKLISGLEEELGARLLTRTTRRVSATEAGMAYYRTAVAVLEDLKAASETMRAHTLQPQGKLKVSVPTSFALMVLSPHLPAFMQAYPELRLEMSLNDRFVDLVEEGFDCAVRIASQLQDSTLVAKKLGRIERVLVASPSYLSKKGTPHSPEDLSRHDCLIYSLSATADVWPLTQQGKPAPATVSGRLYVNNSVMLRESLLAGSGLTLAPHFVVADLLQSGQLVTLLDAFRPSPHDVYGVLPHRKHLPQKVQLFFDFVQDRLGA